MKVTSLICSLLFVSNVFAMGMKIVNPQGEGNLYEVDYMEKMEVLSNLNVPKGIFMGLMAEQDNLKFAANLYEIIYNINKQEGLIDQTEGYNQDIDFMIAGGRYQLGQLKKEISKKIKDEQAFKYFNQLETYESLTDRWFQDWGEFMGVGQNEEGEYVYGVYYVNRDRGLERVVKEIAKMLDLPFIRSASHSGSGGNYGGNIEKTPDGTLFVGSTMDQGQVNQLRSAGDYSSVAILNTDWLAVGHVDEMFSVIPSTHVCDYPANYQGPESNYSIMMADPVLALNYIYNYTGKQKEISYASNNSKGATFTIAKLKKAIRHFLINKKKKELTTKDFRVRRYNTLMRTYKGTNACYKDNSLKKYCFLVEYNVALNKEILSDNEQRLVDATPCLNDDVVRVPELYRKDNYNEGIAFLPGTANLIVLRDHLIVPDPTFDFFKEKISEILNEKLDGSSERNKVHFIMDKAEYHDLYGEVHCGTNVLREPFELFDLYY